VTALGLLEQYRDRFRLRADECQDPYFRCGSGFSWSGIVYEYNALTFGVWIQETARPNATFRAIQAKWPAARLEQVGEGEFTFLFEPLSAKQGAKFLRSIGTHKVKEYDPETKLALQDRMKALNANKTTGREIAP